MSRLGWNLFFAFLIVLIPGTVATGWWYYWPHYQLAQVEKAIAANDLARAEDLLKHFLRQNPDHLRAHFLHAHVLRRLKRPVEAQAALFRAVKLGLPESEGRREFALAEVLKGFTPNAEKNLQEVLKERPNDAEILQALAQGYADSRRWDEADACYTRLVELHPDRLDFLLDRGRTRLASVEFLRTRATDAAADFREILRRSPDHFEGRLYLAHCMLSDARMPEAKRELLHCRQLRPERVEPLVGLVACAVEERDWDQAQALLNQALAREPNSVYVLGMQGDLYLRRQQYDRALPFFQRVVALEPRNKGAHLKLAQALRYGGKLEEAKEQERLYQQLADEEQAARAP